MTEHSKWDWTMSRVAWIDVETDGLVRPGRPMPLCLEVALVVTDGDLNELGRYEAVIRHPDHVLDALDPHPVVVEMHERNGLWNDLRGPNTVPIEEAEQAMVGLLSRLAGDHGEQSRDLDGKDTRPVVWGGFSPSAVDRPVLAHYMPTFYNRLHHRSIDVSALRLAMQNWARVESEPDTEVGHRAMVDTEESIRQANVYRRFLSLAAADRVKAEVRRLQISSSPKIAAAS